jgi:hypothetical protein
MGDGKAIKTSGTGSYLGQTVPTTTIGKKYKFTFDTIVTGGAANATLYGVTIPVFSTSGSQEHTIIATSTTGFNFFGSSSFEGSIDNISLIEVTDDTDLPRINYTNFDYKDVLGDELVTNGSFDTDSDWTLTQATIEDGKLLLSTSDGSYTAATQSLGTIGRLYRITLDVSDIIGIISVAIGGGTDVNITTNGTHTFELTSTSTTFEVKRKFGITNVSATIDNVSVKELTEDVVVPYSGEGSLLLEPQRTNLITDYTGAVFSVFNGASITANDSTSPDGSANSTLITTTGTANQLIQQASISISSGQSYTISGYFKLKSGTLSNSNNAFKGLDGFNGGGITGSTFNSTLTNEWQRLSFNVTSSTTSGRVQIKCEDAAQILIWGLQVELGSYATSIIKTTSAAVTRLADVCNNSGSSDLINSTEGVLYAEIAALADDLTFRLLSLSDGTSNNRIFLGFRNSSNIIYVAVRSQSSTVLTINYNISDITELNKIALKYKQNNFSLYVNGTEAQSITSGNVPIGLDRLNFDGGNGIDDFYGNVKCVAVFKETDIDLEKLTQV